MPVTQILHLLKLSDNEKSILKTEIANSSGEILLLVHPFFLKLTVKKEVYHKLPFKMIEKFIEILKDSEAIFPIIIFEDIRIYNWTESIMVELLHNFPDKKVYLVPTAPDFPAPGYIRLSDRTIKNKRFKPRREKKYWNRFTKLILRLGVKKILIGGTSLELYQLSEQQKKQKRFKLYKAYYQQRAQSGAKNLNYIPTRCVGTTAAWLARVFPIEITNLCLPHSRHDILFVEEQ